MNFGVTDRKQAELEARMVALGLREEDFEEKFIRSSGPGGQKVNKTSSCVVLRHVPSGLEVKMQKERSQPLNRYRARKRLRADGGTPVPIRLRRIGTGRQEPGGSEGREDSQAETAATKAQPQWIVVSDRQPGEIGDRP